MVKGNIIPVYEWYVLSYIREDNNIDQKWKRPKPQGLRNPFCKSPTSR